MSTNSFEPTPIRDNGPYLDAKQARAQFDATTYAIPPVMAKSVILPEALALGWVDLSEYEERVRDHLCNELDPETLQVIASWIVRAYRAGYDHGDRIRADSSQATAEGGVPADLLPDGSVVADARVAYVKNHPTDECQWRGTNGSHARDGYVTELLRAGAKVLRHGVANSDEAPRD